MTRDELKAILSYAPSTGMFRWKVKYSKKVVAGAVAGGLNVAGYVVIGMGGRIYYAHRLAWLYMTGEWPEKVDHKNGARADNRWRNLRLASSQQNALNAKRAASNTSGFKGVSWHMAAGKWSASITINNASKHLGLFDCAESAHEAYLHAAQAVQPEFARSE